MTPKELRERKAKKVKHFMDNHSEEFKALYLSGVSSKVLAKKYKMRSADAGAFARTLIELRPGESLAQARCKRKKLDRAKVLEILNRRWIDDISTSNIAKEFNISISTIQYIVAGRSWKFVYKEFKKKHPRKCRTKRK